MSAPAKTSAIKVPAVGAKSPAVQAPGKTSAKVPAAKAGLKPDSDDLDLKIPDEITLAPALGPALEPIAPDPEAKQVTKGGRGPITKKRKRPAASGNTGSSGSGRAPASGGRRREKAPPVVLIIGIPVLLLGVGIVFLLGGGKPAPSHTAPAATPAPKREPAAVFIPKGLNDPPPSTPAPAAAAATPADAPPAAAPKPGSGRTPEEREAQKAAEEEIAAQKKLIEERTKRLGGEPTGAAAPATPAPEAPASE